MAWTALLLAGSIAAAPAKPASHPMVAFLTDFGLRSESVATCKAVMLGINPDLTIVDITHEVAPFAIRDAANLLERSVRYYPRGAVFVAVVDPGVGTSRRAIAGRTRTGHFLVGPDNGLLSFALEQEGVDEVREVTNTSLFNPLDPVSGIFHGRDIFAPVASHLASGTPFHTVGHVVTDWVRLPRARAEGSAGLVSGEATLIDDVYGNVATNIPAKWAAEAGLSFGSPVEIEVGGRKMSATFVRTFGDVERGAALACPEDQGYVLLALRESSFARAYGVAAGAPVLIRGRKHP